MSESPCETPRTIASLADGVAGRMPHTSDDTQYVPCSPVSTLLRDALIPADEQYSVRGIFKKQGLSPGMIRSGELKRSSLQTIFNMGTAVRLTRLKRENSSLLGSSSASKPLQSTQLSIFDKPDSSGLNLPLRTRLSFETSDDTALTMNMKTPLPMSLASPPPIETSSARDEDSPQIQSRLNNVEEFLVQEKKDRVAASTSYEVLKFRLNYNKKVVKEGGRRFDDADGDQIAVTTMEFIKSNSCSHLSASSKYSMLKHLVRSLRMTEKYISKRVESTVRSMMKLYWNEYDRATKTKEQQQYRIVTHKDTLHLMNSVLLEQQGQPWTYSQIDIISGLVIVQSSSRRFMVLTQPEDA